MRGALKKIEIKLKRLRAATHPLPLPRYHSALAAGMDLFADIDEDIALQPLERRAIPTGWALEIPPGFEAQVRPRSGLALKHGITCLNSPGTIDADYRGEVKVLLVNLGPEPFSVTRGMRIAQLVIARAARARLVETAELAVTSRGTGGFGSTGR